MIKLSALVFMSAILATCISPIPENQKKSDDQANAIHNATQPATNTATQAAIRKGN